MITFWVKKEKSSVIFKLCIFNHLCNLVGRRVKYCLFDHLCNKGSLYLSPPKKKKEKEKKSTVIMREKVSMPIR